MEVFMTEKEKQYFEVMLEKILHEVKTIAEGHSVLDGKIERYHGEAKADHQLSMNLIQHSHEVLKEEIQGVRSELKEEIQSVRSELKEEIQSVSKKLSAKIDAAGSRVEGHEDRIRFLERKTA